MLELVQALLRNPGGAHWESWVAVLSQAVGDERVWMRTVESLDLDSQIALVTALKEDGSLFSDALRALTARHADMIREPDVRDFLLSDAAEATDRMGGWLADHRTKLLALIEVSEARGRPEYDVATEVASLERRLQELRASEIGDKSDRVEELDREIHQLETFQRALANYDVDARLGYRAQLEAETTQSAARRAGLEEEIAAAIGRRDTLERDLATVLSHREALVPRVQTLSDEFVLASERVAEMTRRLDAATMALADARAHLERMPLDRS